MKKNKERKKIFKKISEKKSMPFVFSGGDHLRSTSGIICGSGSFAVQFGDHFRSGDHLRSGIICGAVRLREAEKRDPGNEVAIITSTCHFPVHCKAIVA